MNMSLPGNLPSRKSAVDAATIAIRDKIIMQEFPRGMQLTEVQLAEICGASRGSIRSALQELESEGLLISHPNGRKEIAGIDRQYVEDLYSMRQTLEGKAIDVILTRNYENEYEYIQQVITPFSTLFSSNQSGSKIRALEDMQFHRLLIHVSGNRVLEQCWKVVGPVIWHMQLLNARHGIEGENYENFVSKQHNEMIRLLRERNASLREIIWTHIDNARITNINILTEKNCI